MAKPRKPSVKRRPGPTGTDEQAETRAIQNWLRVMDKPLAKEKGDRKDAEPRDE